MTESLQPYHLRAAGLWILALLALSSCDSSFEPIQENDRYIYSIYGYLDAAADTQWVRVMPVHEKLFAGPEPIDATVTLEDLESGESQVMNDSLFQYAANTYAWNFWTLMELEPTGTYRLTAERSDGVTSHVTVTLPEAFPAPMVYISSGPGYDRVYINGIGNLVDARTFHRVLHVASETEQIHTFPHLEDVGPTATPEEYLIPIDASQFNSFFANYYDSWDLPPRPPLSQRINIQHRQIYIVSAGPDWIDFPEIDEAIIALPDGVSNVENGVGYVVGVIRKTIPYKSCYNEQEEHIPCSFEQPLTSH